MFLFLLVPFSTKLFLKSKIALSSKGGFLVLITRRRGIKKARFHELVCFGVVVVVAGR